MDKVAEGKPGAHVRTRWRYGDGYETHMAFNSRWHCLRRS